MSKEPPKCFTCHQVVAFDNNRRGKNGRMIPLDPTTLTPHDCPAKKQEEQQKAENMTKEFYHPVDSLSIVWQADKNRELLERWYNTFSMTHKVKFSQSHAVALGDSIEYSICVYYQEGQE